MNFRYILYLTLLLALILLFSCNKNQPTENKIPTDSTFTYTDRLCDPDFEYWKVYYGTNNDTLYEDPIGNWWTTLNKLKLIGGPVTATKTTDAHSGKYALRLETMSYGSFVITGLLMTGVFDPSMPGYVIQGKPFTVKPSKFSGYFKYYPANHDTCSFYIGIYKFNTTLMKRDTIAEAYLAVSDTVSQYKLFEMVLNYKMQNVDPDTMKIAIISSAGGEDYKGNGSPQVGSTLYVDDLLLELLKGEAIRLTDDKKKK
jgi:hypothetical protein